MLIFKKPVIKVYYIIKFSFKLNMNVDICVCTCLYIQKTYICVQKTHIKNINLLYLQLQSLENIFILYSPFICFFFYISYFIFTNDLCFILRLPVFFRNFLEGAHKLPQTMKRKAFRMFVTLDFKYTQIHIFIYIIVIITKYLWTRNCGYMDQQDSNCSLHAYNLLRKHT